MNTLKLSSTGKDVIRLCELLGVKSREKFDTELQTIAKNFQKAQGLGVDGVVGQATWFKLFTLQRLKLNSSSIIENEDYILFSEYLGVEPEALEALVKVESSGNGFISPGKPSILFEGHVFWKELKSEGIDPAPLSKRYPGLVYEKWTKEFYLGGAKEYQRFDMASVISPNAALLSTSWGLFQIMGNNFKSCGCSSIEEFHERMCESEFQQFILGVYFLRSSGIYTYLAKKDWTNVAKKYNGSGQVEEYSKKLEEAYNKLKNP